VPVVLFCGLSGPRLRNLSDASAKSSTAPRMLLSCAASFNLPSLPCVPPPSISEMLLNALPIFLRSIFRRSFSLGQSTSTWTTVSLARHSHLSFPWRPCRLPCVASHEWPVRSCVSKYARLRGSDPYIRACGLRVESRQSGGGALLSWTLSILVSILPGFCGGYILSPVREGAGKGVACQGQLLLWQGGLLCHFPGHRSGPGPIGDGGGYHACSTPWPIGGWPG
jgi:hypothetical protein